MADQVPEVDQNVELFEASLHARSPRAEQREEPKAEAPEVVLEDVGPRGADVELPTLGQELAQNGFLSRVRVRHMDRQLITMRGPWRTVEEVEVATLGWVH